MRIRRLIFPVLTFLLLCAAALAEPARVQTPGGPVNMRKKNSAKSVVVAEVPNHSDVEAVEVGETWSKITYKNKTGYVKTEFLLLSSALAGKSVYPDEGFAIAYAAPTDTARILTVFGGEAPIAVESVADGWAAVAWEGQTGYIALRELASQREEPPARRAWIAETGKAVRDCEIRLSADESAALPAGTAVTVTRLLSAGECLVHAPQGWGYAAQDAICLDVYPDETAAPAGVIDAAEAALRKAYKDFGKQRLYAVATALPGGLYRCAFFTDDDRHLYSALTDERGSVQAESAYTAFAVPDRAAALLPDGQMDVALSAETLGVGEVLDITVSAWTAHQCGYTLEGPLPARSEPGAHFAAAWRPRAAGAYTLTVTVTDEAGQTVSQSREITVTAGAAAAVPAVYSQKDGWWLDKPYRNSTLDQSGCAIFTLSHALTRMGRSGDALLPENLARAYALCLTPDGTNNERLIREAGADWGFQTKGALIHDEKQIKALLNEGAMFSFSIARGHIALVTGLSADGAMAQVADSAPGATFERIVNDSLYTMTRSGGFRAVTSLDAVSGARWYFETGEYGGLEYWLRLSYVARRGVRLIQP